MPASKGKNPPGRPPKIPSSAKRKNKSTLTNKAKKKCLNQSAEPSCIDQCCWICHELAKDKTCSCQRVYHYKCLARAFKEFKYKKCPECQAKSVDGTKTTRPFSGLLGYLLESVLKLIIAEKCKKNSIYLNWPNKHSRIVKKIDFNILLEKIKNPTNEKKESYASTSEFYSDVKWIYHNCCVVYGEQSEQAKNAKKLVACFKEELSSIEACPECYYHLYVISSTSLEDESSTRNSHGDVSDIRDSNFVRLCKPPHDIVWAQVRGHPYWPAKCLKVVNGMAHVRFFGEFEKSNLPAEKILHITEVHPQNKNDRVTDDSEVPGRSSLKYYFSKKQFVKYIRLYEEEFKHKFPFFQQMIVYKSENEVAEKQVLCSRTPEKSAKINRNCKNILFKDKLCTTKTKVVSTEIITGPPTIENTLESNNALVLNLRTDSLNIANISATLSGDAVSEESLAQPISKCAIFPTTNTLNTDNRNNTVQLETGVIVNSSRRSMGICPDSSSIIVISDDEMSDDISPCFKTETTEKTDSNHIYPLISRFQNQTQSMPLSQILSSQSDKSTLPATSTNVSNGAFPTVSVSSSIPTPIEIDRMTDTILPFLKPKTEKTEHAVSNCIDNFHVPVVRAIPTETQSILLSQVSSLQCDPFSALPATSTNSLRNALKNNAQSCLGTVKEELSETMQDTSNLKPAFSEDVNCNPHPSGSRIGSLGQSCETSKSSNGKAKQFPKSSAITPDAMKSVDDDVIVLDSTSANSNISLHPSVLLSCLFGGNQRMHSLIQDGKSFMDAFILRILLEASSCSGASAVLTQMVTETTKLKSELEDLRREREKFHGLEKLLEKEIHDLRMNLNIERQKNIELEKIVSTIKINAGIAIDSLNRNYTKLLTEKLASGNENVLEKKS